MMIAFPQLFPQVFPKGLVAMARHHAVPDDTALDRLIIRLIMMKVPKAPSFLAAHANYRNKCMHTVAFCQAFLWMIVMTFYHTAMPTVAQAWYFDTFLQSLA